MGWNEDQGDRREALEARREECSYSRLGGGLVLMTIGMIFLLGRLDVLPGHGMSTYWPLIIVAVGVGRLLEQNQRRRPGSAVWLIFVGLWAQATVLHWFGLSWRNSWPIVLIFVGLCTLVTELIGKSKVGDAQ